MQWPIMLLSSSILCGAPKSQKAEASPETVVLLHGLARTSGSMRRLETALRRDGYAVVNWIIQILANGGGSGSTGGASV
jgi:predicted alpha/beta-fold hydrolase